MNETKNIKKTRSEKLIEKTNGSVLQRESEINSRRWEKGELLTETVLFLKPVKTCKNSI